jgi:branched-chain amino acid transport system permease protein
LGQGAPVGRGFVRAALWVVPLCVLAAAPLFATYYQMAIIIAIEIGVMGAIAANLLLGVAGQASIGNAAFMAIGAFAAATLATEAGLPFMVGVLGGGLAAAGVGVLVAIPAMRVRGLYLIIATLALFYVAVFALTRFQVNRVGDSGFVMPAVRIGSLGLVKTWFYIMGAFALGSVLVMRNLLRTRFGRAWAAIARDEVGASVLGVKVRQQKVVVFSLSSFIIGVQGALFGYYVGVVSIDPFTLDLAITFIAMIVIGGLGSVAGSVIGAIFVSGLPYLITWLAGTLPTSSLTAGLQAHIFDVESMVYGLAIVGFLIWERRGLVYLFDRGWRRVNRLADRVFREGNGAQTESS